MFTCMLITTCLDMNCVSRVDELKKGREARILGKIRDPIFPPLVYVVALTLVPWGNRVACLHGRTSSGNGLINPMVVTRKGQGRFGDCDPVEHAATLDQLQE